MTRANFTALFPTTTAAISAEERILSIGSEFLPAEAQAVRDEEIDEPSEAYWDWLADQIQTDDEDEDDAPCPWMRPMPYADPVGY